MIGSHVVVVVSDQDPLLHVFHAVVVFLEDGFRCGEVDVVDAELSPRHARQPVEVVASHTATDTQVNIPHSLTKRYDCIVS